MHALKHPVLGSPTCDILVEICGGEVYILYFVCVDCMQFQLIRIELRVPEYGWTTQKVFHLMNFIVNGGNYESPV